MSALALVLAGATGRMGQCIVRLLDDLPQWRLHAALGSPGSALLGRDIGELAGARLRGVHVGDALAPALAGADVVVDFSLAAGVAGHLAACAAARVPLLIAGTGLDPSIEAAVAQAAGSIPVLVAPNTSLGVTVLLDLVARAAQRLVGFDLQIVEAHHRAKRDAPSGTALALGRASERADVGYASVRGGDVIGEHEVLFLGAGERVILSHSASDRTVFARGALRAAQWLARARPGRYTMSDIL